MQPIKVIIKDFRPIPLSRPRFSKHTGKAFDSQKKDKQLLGLLFRTHFKTPLTTPISLKIEFNYLSAKKGTAMTSRPDLDNLIKFVLDAGNGIIWADDALIYELSAVKRYSDHNSIVLTGSTLEL